MVFNENGVILNEGLFSKKKVNSAIIDKYNKFDYDNPIPNDFSSQSEADKFCDNYSKKCVIMLKELVNMCKTLEDYKWVKRNLIFIYVVKKVVNIKINYMI